MKVTLGQRGKSCVCGDGLVVMGECGCGGHENVNLKRVTQSRDRPGNKKGEKGSAGVNGALTHMVKS